MSFCIIDKNEAWRKHIFIKIIDFLNFFNYYCVTSM